MLGCRQVDTGEFVAVKVNKATSRQARFAEVEAETLRALERQDAKRYKRFIIRLLGTFVHAGENLCMVFEPLALSLRELISKAGKVASLLLRDIRVVAVQLLYGISFLHSAGFAHTDIKCTNVMLRSSRYELVPHPREIGKQAARPYRPCEAVLIDFGCALKPSHQDRADIERGKCRPGARHVRAPEIVLGLRWNISIDLWSLGTLLFSLYTGTRLFRIHEDVEHLAAMERICGSPIPLELAREVAPRIADRGVAFDPATGRILWPGRPGDTEAKARVNSTPPLEECILPCHSRFLALLHELLELNPGQRISAEGALQRPFIKDPVVSE